MQQCPNRGKLLLLPAIFVFLNFEIQDVQHIIRAYVQVALFLLTIGSLQRPTKRESMDHRVGCYIHGSGCLGDHKNLLSPDASRRLPTELLACIFIHVARDSYNSYCTPTEPGWVKVSYVCRHWRDVALSCATLWSYIPTTSKRWTQELLARSQMAPLEFTGVFTRLPYHQRGRTAQLLSIVDQLMNHSQRIHGLYLHFGTSIRTKYRCLILSKFLSSHLPCLQLLEISHFNLPKGRSCQFLFEENTPALRTLRLVYCHSVPWYALGSSVLTTLYLSNVGSLIPENTMANFLAMLRRMPHLVQLFVEHSLPSARDFLSNGESNAIPIIILSRLSNMSITKAPLSAVTALLSCVDMPSRTKVHLQCRREVGSTLDDYTRLASLLGRRISQCDSPKFRSLTVSTSNEFKQIVRVAFSTSEHYIPASYWPTESDDDTLLKVNLVSSFSQVNKELDYPELSCICRTIPLTNIQRVHFLGLPPSLEFWKDMLTSLSDVRHIRISEKMPNITSMLSLPSFHFTRSWQDGRTGGGQGEIFVPALEELELYKIVLGRACEGRQPNPHVADVQDLYDAIATRRETRCQLSIKSCCIATRTGGGVINERVARSFSHS